jgi:two-component system phosphate regulon sensor histidine kinase PhoR
MTMLEYETPRHPPLAGPGPAQDPRVSRQAPHSIADDGLPPSIANDALMISTVAHDLKTPLAALQAVLGFVLDELLPRDDANAAAREQLAIARRVTLRMRGLVDALLDMTANGTPHLVIRPTLRDPAEMLAEAMELLGPSARERRIELTAVAEGVLPRVSADGDRIGQVLANLGANALKFTSPGGRVQLAAKSRAGVVRFSVTDTGCGISSGDLPKVFDRYWRADGIAGAETGLGLAIVKEIVASHAGTVEAESRVGVGSRFSFTLPAAAASAPLLASS